jgi:hypothetical protein
MTASRGLDVGPVWQHRQVHATGASRAARRRFRTFAQRWPGLRLSVPRMRQDVQPEDDGWHAEPAQEPARLWLLRRESRQIAKKRQPARP